ncbi:hypothetical protein HHO38_18985 [Parabacteroides distasonis]|uniref:Uncharacterized protein n=1 Tax=Parabacteroides distasonis TaxID=823 RepID=A0A7L5EHX5_PARDI|nr:MULTISPECIES: hypothetical protein [Bacteroidales]QJE30235.1 hypothetical protein HHO38_18985 [Parabacteroides distasonis]WRY44995.1 hypothetical protein P8F78_07395 [Parabacteroides distasonis]
MSLKLYSSVSHSFSMHGCKGTHGFDGSGKVGRQSHMHLGHPATETSD